MAAEEAQIFMTFGGYLLNMASAVAGGLLVIAGNHITAGKSHKLNQESSKLQLKREKLEQLVTAAYEMRPWLRTSRNISLSNAAMELSEFPIYKIEMLSKLYIPELEYEVYKLIKVTVDYQLWIIDGQQKRKENQALNKSYLQKINPIDKELIDSIRSIADKAADIMTVLNKH